MSVKLNLFTSCLFTSSDVHFVAFSTWYHYISKISRLVHFCTFCYVIKSTEGFIIFLSFFSIFSNRLFISSMKTIFNIRYLYVFYTIMLNYTINHYPAKLIYLNFQPLEVVSRYRDP